MSMPDLTCAEVDDRDLESSYLAGRLTAEEAEAYEAHYFGCERCWRTLETALAVRSASGARRPARFGGRALAAAATVVLAVAGGWWITTRGPASPDDALRGAGDVLAVQLVRGPAGLEVSWVPRPDADRYRVRIFGADGGLLLERSTADTAVVVTPPAGAAFVEVTVLGALLQVLDGSGLVPVAAPR
jgi:hypothetical protein